MPEDEAADSARMARLRSCRWPDRHGPADRALGVVPGWRSELFDLQPSTLVAMSTDHNHGSTRAPPAVRWRSRRPARAPRGSRESTAQHFPRSGQSRPQSAEFSPSVRRYSCSALQQRVPDAHQLGVIRDERGVRSVRRIHHVAVVEVAHLAAHLVTEPGLPEVAVVTELVQEPTGLRLRPRQRRPGVVGIALGWIRSIAVPRVSVTAMSPSVRRPSSTASRR